MLRPSSAPFSTAIIRLQSRERKAGCSSQWSSSVPSSKTELSSSFRARMIQQVRVPPCLFLYFRRFAHLKEFWHQRSCSSLREKCGAFSGITTSTMDLSPTPNEQILNSYCPINKRLRLKRRNPVTLPENEKLIAAAVGAASLIHFIKSKRRLAERVAHRLFVLPAQQVEFGKLRTIAKINILVAKR